MNSAIRPFYLVDGSQTEVAKFLAAAATGRNDCTAIHVEKYTTSGRFDALDVLDIHDEGAMDTAELLGVKPTAELA